MCIYLYTAIAIIHIHKAYCMRGSLFRATGFPSVVDFQDVEVFQQQSAPISRPHWDRVCAALCLREVGEYRPCAQK